MNKLKKIIYPLIAFIQAALWCAIITIEYLTTKKAGVMHHVYFKRYEYSKSISNESLYILSVIALILALLFFIWFIYLVKSNKNKFYIVQTIISTFMAIILALVIKLQFFENLLSYYYFIMIALVVLVIQIIWNIVVSIKYK